MKLDYDKGKVHKPVKSLIKDKQRLANEHVAHTGNCKSSTVADNFRHGAKCVPSDGG